MYTCIYIWQMLVPPHTLQWLAVAPDADILAYLRSTTLLARARDAIMVGDARPRIYCTCFFCGYARIPAICHTPCSCFFGDYGGRCLIPRISFTGLILLRLCSHIEAPPHSLHCLLIRLCYLEYAGPAALLASLTIMWARHGIR
jgi:hypothetical protein